VIIEIIRGKEKLLGNGRSFTPVKLGETALIRKFGLREEGGTLLAVSQAKTTTL
jgi:hypothetical protein